LRRFDEALPWLEKAAVSGTASVRSAVAAAAGRIASHAGLRALAAALRPALSVPRHEAAGRETESDLP
jgi:hypothetical protein